jgi:hypothetical protein
MTNNNLAGIIMESITLLFIASRWVFTLPLKRPLAQAQTSMPDFFHVGIDVTDQGVIS